MKKSVFLAIIGAAALTGCQNEVMKTREYIPAPQDDAAAITAPAPAVSDRSGEQTAPEAAPKDAPAAAPEKRGAGSAQEFPPMTGTFSNTGISDADAADAKAGAAAGGEYIVKRGDTLGKIAAAHRVKLSALMKANNLSEKDAKKLRVGRKLVIPGGKDAAANGGKSAKSGKGGKRSFGGASSAATLEPGEYIVKAGDTPEKIARRAGVKLSALMEANNFTEEKARRLRIGQKIVIPGKGAAAGTKSAAKSEKKAVKTETKSAAAAPVETKPAAKSDDDIVNEMESSTVKGAKDTAAPTAATAPAADAGATVVATAPSPDAERTSYVQVKEDISIGAFASQHGTTPEVIRQLNPDLTGDTLVKNRIYEVPKK